jgi:hypothetical protein
VQFVSVTKKRRAIKPRRTASATSCSRASSPENRVDVVAPAVQRLGAPTRDNVARMRTVIVVLGCASWLGGGCGGTSPAPNGPSPAQTCAERSRDVGSYLETMERDPAGLRLEPGWELPHRDDGRTTGPLVIPEVLVRSGELRYSGHSIRDVDSLRGYLDVAHKKIAEEAQMRGLDLDVDRIALQIDRATPWAEVVAVSEATARTEFTHQYFVFARHPDTPPPPRTPIDDRIEQLLANDPYTREVADVVSEVFAPCPALVELQHQPLAPDEDRGELLIASAETALNECDCAADPEAVRSVIWQVVGSRHPINVVDVYVSEDAPQLAFAATARWADAAVWLEYGAEIRLVVAPSGTE